MNSSEWYRRAPGLLAGVVLLLSCFLLSGCKLNTYPVLTSWTICSETFVTSSLQQRSQ